MPACVLCTIAGLLLTEGPSLQFISVSTEIIDSRHHLGSDSRERRLLHVRHVSGRVGRYGRCWLEAHAWRRGGRRITLDAFGVASWNKSLIVASKVRVRRWVVQPSTGTTSSQVCQTHWIRRVPRHQATNAYGQTPNAEQPVSCMTSVTTAKFHTRTLRRVVSSLSFP